MMRRPRSLGITLKRSMLCRRAAQHSLASYSDVETASLLPTAMAVEAARIQDAIVVEMELCPKPLMNV
jgi:hypothetical protein